MKYKNKMVSPTKRIVFLNKEDSQKKDLITQLTLAGFDIRFSKKVGKNEILFADGDKFQIKNILVYKCKSLKNKKLLDLLCGR